MPIRSAYGPAAPSRRNARSPIHNPERLRSVTLAGNSASRAGSVVTSPKRVPPALLSLAAQPFGIKVCQRAEQSGPASLRGERQPASRASVMASAASSGAALASTRSRHCMIAWSLRNVDSGVAAAAARLMSCSKSAFANSTWAPN